MKPKSHRFTRPIIGVAIFMTVAGLTVFISGQQRGQMANPQSAMNVPILSSGPQPDSLDLPGLPDDWSFRHLNFTDPGTEEDAISAGRHEQWLRIVTEPRYIIQQLKRRQPAQGPFAEYVAKMNKIAQMQEESGGTELIIDRAGQLEAAPRPVKGHRPARPKLAIDRDWSMELGAGVAASLTATVAAPASGNISGSSTLTVDGVTLDASPPTTALQSGTFTGNPSNGQTLVIANPPLSTSITLTASVGTAGTQTGTFNSVPTTSSGAITVVNSKPSNTLTVTTNATAANATGTFASFPLSSSSITISPSGNTLTLSPNGTGAYATGTFTSAPLSTSSISVKSGSNTLALTPGGTGSTMVGTTSAAPASNTTVSLTSQSNTLTLSNGGTGAHGTGTFSAYPLGTATISIDSNGNTLVLSPGGTGTTDTGTFSTVATAGNTVTITSASNTLVLRAGSIGTISIAGRPSTGDTIQVGTVTYTFSDSCGSTANCISRISSGSDSTWAGNVYAAITDSTSACTADGTGTGCFSNVTAANPDVTATFASGVVTLTNTQSSAITFTTSDATNITLSPTGGTIPLATNTCSSSTAGSFKVDTTTAAQASDLAAAINACNSSYAAVGATATYTSGSAFTITDAYPGSATTFTLSETGSGFSWGTETAGTNGTTNSCTSATAGTFETSNSTSTLASNLSATINACNTSYPAVAATGTYTTGASFTVTDTTLGTGGTLTLTDSNTTTPATFAWGSVTAGSNGSNACTSSTTGTYAAATTAATFASNLSAAINACNTSYPAVGATSSYTSPNTTFTVTDAYPGSGTTFSGSQTNATSIFSWGSVTAGGNGSANSCSSATVGTYETSTSPATLASNLAAAINACNTAYSAVGATASYTSPNTTLTVTDAYPGASINTFTVTDTNTTTPAIFSWSTVTAGTNGSNGCTVTSNPFSATFATSTAVATLASNAVAAINACNTANPALGATAAVTTGGSFKVSTTALDTPATALTTGVSNGSGIFTWAATVAGTPGSNGCTGSTTATYAYNSSTTSLANNFITALNLCTGSTGITNTSSNSGATVTITSTTWSSSPGVTLSPTASGGFFQWAASTITNGTSGNSTAPNFAVDNVLSDDAANLVAAITASGQGSTVGVTATNTSGSATLTISASAAGSSGDGITLANGLSNITLASPLAGGTDGTTSGTTFAYWSGSTDISQSALAQNIAYAINNNSTLEDVVTATSNSNASDNLTITALAGGTAGNSYTVTAASFTAFSPTTGSFSGGEAAGLAADQYPAKYSFSTSTASCSDYVIYPTGMAGSNTQATLVAYTNLYGTSTTGCGSSPGGSVPEVYWAYNTPVSSTNGTAALSPVIDPSGTQVAFVETVSGTAYLVLLRMANTGSTITTPALASSAANYPTCTAPCYYYFGLGATDSNSPPYYDYVNDAIYVGNDSGSLYKFSPAFNGTPAQAWAGTVSSHTNKHLTGAVVDPQSPNYVYVCDNSGYLFSVTASTGAVNGTSSQMDYNGGFADTPLIDTSSTTSRIYTFSQHYGSPTSGDTGTYINQFTSSSSINGNAGTSRQIGTATSGEITLPVYDGTFDNQHTTYSNGNLYFCALTSSSTHAYPTLYRVAMGTTFSSTTVTTITALTTAAAGCSPISEFYDGTNDWLFLSVTTGGSQTSTACSGSTAACLYNFNATSSLAAATTATSGLAVAGGASGVIIDNNVPSSTLAGASQIYFSSLGGETCSTSGGTGACAVQASQSNPSGPVYGTGTVTVIPSIGLTPGDDVVIGPSGSTITYTAQTEALSCGSGPCFWWGTSNDTAAQSLYAAITDNPSNCPTTPSGDWPDNGCFTNISAANPYVSATWSSGTAIVNLTNTLGSNLVFTTNNTSDITLSPSNGTLP